jgi:hypothetical protein
MIYFVLYFSVLQIRYKNFFYILYRSFFTVHHNFKPSNLFMDRLNK